MRLRKVVEANLEDEHFGIHELCREIGTEPHAASPQGQSPDQYCPTSGFIRFIRLLRAKKLLVVSDLNISQVAFEVGFRDPKYFSRTFQEEFGKPPIEMRK
ncbi:MAG: helix-turn-helix transcriptional regulator [Lewinellaceae bacterium]|nr:helix-turn-helix transcriptional regulator [Lewinellaceae bacterium]